MSKLFKCCLPVILFCTFSILACKKTTVEPNALLNEVLSPPPPQLCLGSCNISDGGGFFQWFAKPIGGNEGELHFELSKQTAPFNITYDANNNPLTCQGHMADACYWKYYNSVFNYVDGKLTSISVDETYGQIGCPQYTSLPTIHTGTRIDFTYTSHVQYIGGLPIIFPVIKANVYKSDTVPVGQNFTSWTASGRTYYYEYTMSGDKLRIKRYKADATTSIREFTYTYDADGRLTQTSMFQDGAEKYRKTIYSFDTKKNFASGNKITQLLTSTYGKNNSMAWYIQSWYGAPTISYFSANYLYNMHCYPVSTNITVNGQASVGPTINYTCN